jgi:hypothetical protein
MMEKPIRIERHSDGTTTTVYETKPDPFKKAIKDLKKTLIWGAGLLLACRVFVWLEGIWK